MSAVQKWTGAPAGTKWSSLSPSAASGFLAEAVLPVWLLSRFWTAAGTVRLKMVPGFPLFAHRFPSQSPGSFLSLWAAAVQLWLKMVPSHAAFSHISPTVNSHTVKPCWGRDRPNRHQRRKVTSYTHPGLCEPFINPVKFDWAASLSLPGWLAQGHTEL